MSYAAVMARERYEERVFQFKNEPPEESFPATKLDANCTLYHWMPGFEFFEVYPWLRDKYRVL